MRNEVDPIEKAILKRDPILAESGEENRSFVIAAILNGVLAVIRLCVLIYCLFVACAHILILSKYELNAPQVINIVIELIISIFVIHDTLAAGGWRPGVSNSLWLMKIAKLIPYYAHNEYYTFIPKNYLRAALLLFVASINNMNDTYESLQEIRILNIAVIVLSLFFICIGYFAAIKRKLMSFYVDWIIENYVNSDTKQPIKYETNTWFGWVSIGFNILFFLFAIACYCIILATKTDSAELFVIIACIAKCLLSIAIIVYLIIHRRILVETNWCSIFILLFSLNVSINLLYDFKSDGDISLNIYCIYVWFGCLLIEALRFTVIIVLYFKSMYRYYTPFKNVYTNIVENIHFWFIKQGITKIALILILLALPFLIIVLSYDWFTVDMRFTPFFDYTTPFTGKFFTIENYFHLFEDIWAEVGELLDIIEVVTAISDEAMCILIISAFAAILVASIFPTAASGAANYYRLQRILKTVKRLAEMFKKIYSTIQKLIDKIRRIIKKVKDMLNRVDQFVAFLNRISPKYVGISSVAGLFGLILIPTTTVIIILYISFFNRSLRFNSYQISAHSQHWLWLLFSAYLLLLNIANLLVIMSLQALLTEIFVFETVVFEAQVLTSDGYDALFAVHILIIVGLALFIMDRLFIKYCQKCSEYSSDEEALHSYCKCKATTPSIQELIAFLVEYHEWNEEGIMSYDDMVESIQYKDGLERESASAVDIMCQVTWSCVRYNKFDQNNRITKKEWEYFLTSYKIGSFPWTQPASLRNMSLQNKMKLSIDTVYSSNDHIAYYKFHEHGKDDIETLNVNGCKQIIANLRGVDEEHLDLISDNDLAVKIFLNLSKQQLNHLLTRFEKNVWQLIIAKDVINDLNDDGYYAYDKESPKGQHIHKDSESYEGSGGGFANKTDAAETKYNDTKVIADTAVSEIELNPISDKLPPGWRKIINEEGLVYYHHDRDNITQWDRPSEREEILTEQTETETEEEELPTGWEQIVNEEGLTYYHNKIIEQTQWERPKYKSLKLDEKEQEDTEVDIDDEEEEGALPEFWRVITNNGGTKYYHNDKLQKTQWENPLKSKPYTNTKTKTKSLSSRINLQVQALEEEEEKEEEYKEDRAGNTKTASTQTTLSMDGVFERKLIYHIFFSIAFNDILNKKNVFKDETTKIEHEQSIDEDEVILIALIDSEWVRLNEILKIALNSDNEDVNYKPDKFPAKTVYAAINNDDKMQEILNMGISQQWVGYLNQTLIEYNNKYATDNLILTLPKRQHFETWCIYIILCLLVTIWSVYSVTNYDFMSLKYQPAIEFVNTVNSLVKAKESLRTEWNVTDEIEFGSYDDFYTVSDEQFYDCDIGSIFTYFPSNPLKKYNSFATILASMKDGFTMSDIPLIELLDEIDTIDVEAVGLGGLPSGGIDGVGEILDIDYSAVDFDINGDFSFVQFPMIEINTWPAMTISFYWQWCLLMLFAPTFSLILVCCLFGCGCYTSYKRKSGEEVNKQLYAMMIIFAGFCGLAFMISLGSVISVVSTYLPHNIVVVSYEYGYYNMVSCNLLVMLIGFLVFIDIIAGEHVPLLSRIFRKKAIATNTRAHSQQSGTFVE